MPNCQKMEIEHKFLVTSPLPRFEKGVSITQAYLHISDQKEIRIRLMNRDCFLTIKFPTPHQNCRMEYEYAIPYSDGKELIEKTSSQTPIKKKRFTYMHRGMQWYVDFFEGANQGLVLAEIELSALGEEINKPPWIGKDITGDKKYSGARLFLHPYKNWKQEK